VGSWEPWRSLQSQSGFQQPAGVASTLSPGVATLRPRAPSPLEDQKTMRGRETALRARPISGWSAWRWDAQPEPASRRVESKAPYFLPRRARASRSSTSRTTSATSSCSHTLRTCQPASRRTSVFRWSRSRVAVNLRFHHASFVIGRVACSGHECQKQPSMKIATRSRGNKTSAVHRSPGTGRT